jgi:mono/diheme cytochrome c family protein
MALAKSIMIVFSGVAALAACSEGPKIAESDLVAHSSNSESGRALFVEKGCVICHSVNGVGGKAAPALDAPIGAPAIDSLEFAARMWRGAPAMIELQSIELGYTIYLTADEIGDLAAFAADRDAQKTVSLEGLPENIRNGLLDERFWEMEDWDAFLRSGQENAFPEDGASEDEGMPQ